MCQVELLLWHIAVSVSPPLRICVWGAHGRVGSHLGCDSAAGSKPWATHVNIYPALQVGILFPELCVAVASLLAGSDLVSLKLSQVSLWSLLAQPLPSLLQQETNNQGSSCSRQNSVEERLRSINTCHHSVSTTTVNAPEKWEQPEFRLPSNLKPLLLDWALPVVVLLNLCSAWLSRCDWVTWITSVCSNDCSWFLLFNLIGSISRLTKYLTPAPVPPSAFDLGTDPMIRGPWWVCEDL